jgi:hypothetical protein
MAYWTKQREIADRYAQWVKHKADIAEIIMTQIAAPERLIKTLAADCL